MTRRCLVLAVGVICFIVPVRQDVLGKGGAAQTVGAVSQQPPPVSVAAEASSSRAILDKYCATCHNQRLHTAGLSLDAMDLAHVGDNAEV